MSRIPAFLQGAALGLASSVLAFNFANADTQEVRFNPVEDPEACIAMAEASMAYSDSIIYGDRMVADCHTAEDGSTYMTLQNVQ